MPVLNMTRVATYVFIDLETTGFPQDEFNKTRITELSMVVVKRRHILDTRPGAAPRVQEKLTLCFNPRKAIHPDSTTVSGLDNELLEHQTPFNMNVFITINSFLQCFEKPVCLIAQNGHTFDFPILKNHFEKLGVSLSEDILCADSLYAFHDIFEVGRSLEANEVDVFEVDHGAIGVKAEQPSSANKIVDEETKSDQEICFSSNTHLEEHITKDMWNDFLENDDLKFQQSLQEQNERTPKTKKRHSPVQVKGRKKVSRDIFYKMPGKKAGKKPDKSYKLKNIYERILARPAIEAHRAENDCTMAMEVSVAIAKEFVQWIDNPDNHCKFSEVKAMKLGVKIGE